MRKTIYVALLFSGCTCFLRLPAQETKDPLSEWDLDGLISNYNTPPLYEINRMPINICFIKNNQRYTGFVIAGHATKEICGVASLQVKNLLDSLGYAGTTIFSYGVGFDLRIDNWSLEYSNRLARLEKTFIELQKQDPGQVKVLYASHSRFITTLQKIEDNTLWAQSALAKKNSVNRIIFRYQNIDFPLPVPFYTQDGIISFDIPKSEIGAIPGVKVFGIEVVNRALKEIEHALAFNAAAAAKLDRYEPTTALPNFKEHPYPIVISKLKGVVTDTLFQVDLKKTLVITEVGSGKLIRYYSLEELKKMCDQGMDRLPDKLAGKNINPCTAYRNELTFISSMNEKKRLLQYSLQRLDKFYEAQWVELTKMKEEFRELKKDNNHIIIDAFLRGWLLATDNKPLDVQLDTWYKKRKGVWTNVLKKNPVYKARLQTKTNQVKPPDDIAGIFQCNDVFFLIKDAGNFYKITPYKMLGGEFVEVIDKQTQVSQFFSVNNYRSIKL